MIFTDVHCRRWYGGGNQPGCLYFNNKADHLKAKLEYRTKPSPVFQVGGAGARAYTDVIPYRLRMD